MRIRYGLRAREGVDLRRSFHENNQGTERYKNCIAFSMCSDAFHQLKCHSRRQRRQREKRTLHGPGYPSIRRCLNALQPQVPRAPVSEFWPTSLSPNAKECLFRRKPRIGSTGLSKEVYLGGKDRLTRVQVLFTRKPTPHRSSVVSGRIIATTTKICTGRTIQEIAGSRQTLQLVPRALLHSPGLVTTSRLVYHR